MRISAFEPTPNPNALKCVLAEPQLGGVRSYRDVASAAGDPLGLALLGVPGVVGVLIHEQFITVSRAEGVPWTGVRKAVQRAVEAAGGQGDPAEAGEGLAGPGR